MPRHLKLRVKRVYEPPTSSDGFRVLVDRLWPRGVNKAALRLDAWLKEAAPSGALRRWFAHDPRKWREFRERYFEELDAKAEALKPLVEAARREPVTLVYGARDTEHNNAMALRDYLVARWRRSGCSASRRAWKKTTR